MKHPEELFPMSFVITSKYIIFVTRKTNNQST